MKTNYIKSVLFVVAVLCLTITVFVSPFYIDQKLYFFDSKVAIPPQIQVIELTKQSLGYKHFGIGFHDSERTFYNTTTLREISNDDVMLYAVTTYKVINDSYYTVWISTKNQFFVNSTQHIYKLYIWWTVDINYTTFILQSFSDATTALQWAINNTDKIRVLKGTYILNQTIYLDSYTELDGNNSYFVFTGTPPIFKTENCTNVIIQNLNCTIHSEQK